MDGEWGDEAVYFRLARELGGRTVDELLPCISSSELTKWAAIFSKEDDDVQKK